MRRARRSLVAALGALAAVAAVPVAADAAVSCAYDQATKVVSITGGGAPGKATVSLRRSGQEIKVETGSPMSCGPATPMVDNTDLITWTPTGAAQLIVNLTGGRLSPGATPEGVDNDSEIELAINASSATDAQLTILRETGATTTRIGTGGIDLSTAELNPDADISLFGVTELSVTSGSGNDTLDARGGAGAGAPSARAMNLDGGGGDDHIFAGTGNVSLRGGPGNDDLHGGSGADKLYPGVGDDTAAGGTGWDWLSYQDVAAPVTFDLEKTVQATGAGTDTVTGVEQLFGGVGADTLLGTAGADVISGDRGDDLLIGRGGKDLLNGDDDFDTVDYGAAPGPVVVTQSQSSFTAVVPDGNDTLYGIEGVAGSPFADAITLGDGVNQVTGRGGADTIATGAGDDIVRVRDGGHDTVACGAGDDVAVGDAPGVDAATGCEELSLLPAPIADPLPLPAVDSTAPALTGLHLDPARIRAGHSTRVRGDVGEAATILLTVARRHDGRTTVLGTITRAVASGAIAIKLARTVAGHRLRRGRYRVSAVARDAAGNASAAVRMRLRVT